MTKWALTCVSAMHITASVFINDDESGLHHYYEVWLERLAPHAPIDQCRPRGRLHNRTGKDNADAHLKRNATRSVARDGVPSEAVVVAVTNGRLGFGTWERFLGDSWMADTGVSTAGGGSGCWSRSLGNRGAQSHLARNGLWLW